MVHEEVEDLGDLDSTLPKVSGVEPVPPFDAGEGPLATPAPTGAGEGPMPANAPTGEDASKVVANQLPKTQRRRSGRRRWRNRG
jgi:hypothetical protein